MIYSLRPVPTDCLSQIERLRARATEIDSRLGPIPGHVADILVKELRAAADAIETGKERATMADWADWADHAAELHLGYLRECCDRAESIKYLASVLRAAEASGASRGAVDAAKGTNVKQEAAPRAE